MNKKFFFYQYFLNLRVLGMLIFIASMIIVGLNINFPHYLKPKGYWFSRYSLEAHYGDNFILRFTLHAPEVETRSNFFFDNYTYQLDTIYYGFAKNESSHEIEPSEVCIDKLIVSNLYPYGENLIAGHSPLCTTIDKQSENNSYYIIDMSKISSEPISYLIALEANTFYYPFIRSSESVMFQVVYHTIINNKESETKTLIPGLDILIDDQARWDVDLIETEHSLSPDVLQNSRFISGDATSIKTIISGPLYFQILSVFLIFGMASLIGLMLSIKSTSSFTQALAAALFGIYGARQILSPQNIQAKTILDLVFVFLYAFATYAIIDHILFKVISTRKTTRSNHTYVSAISSSVFHEMSCNYVKKIPNNKLMYFSNINQARDKNLELCKRCEIRISHPKENEVTN